MNCPHCGHACPDDAALCPACNTALTAQADMPSSPETPVSETVEATAPVALPKKRRKINIAAGITFSLIVFSSLVYVILLKFLPPSMPIAEMLPQECPALVSADAHWWWNALEEARADSQVKAALAQVDTALGVSLEKDVIPWVGNVGVAVLNPDQAKPQALVFVQVRNRAKFLATLPRLLARAEENKDVKWRNTTYKNIALRRATITVQQQPLQLTTGQLGGWFVLGIGGGTLEQSIDAWKGSIPSLKKNAKWTKALAELPRNPRLFIAANGKPLYDGIKPLLPLATQTQLLSRDNYDYSVIGTLTGNTDTLRFETIAFAESKTVLTNWKEIAGFFEPIDGEMLAQVPEGMFATMIFSHPGKLWQFSKDKLAQTPDPRVAMMYAGIDTQIAPLFKITDLCDEEFGISFMQQKDAGFGMMVLGKATDNAQARTAAKRLQGFIAGKMNGFAIPENNGVYTIPSMMGNADARPQPAWTARDNWFTFTTNNEWLADDQQKTRQRLPGEAKGASMIFLANLSFLPTGLDKLEKEPGADVALLKKIRALKLEKAEVLGYAKMTADGEMQQSVLQLEKCPWQPAVAQLVQLIRDQKTKQQ